MSQQIRAAVNVIQNREDAVYVTPQNLIEFWNVWTRPVTSNGFGHTPDEAATAIDLLRTVFRYAEDTPEILGEWLRLAREAGVSGVQVHDTRLVAVMLAHGITHLLTLNPQDFTRFTGITVVTPQTLAGGAA